MRHLRYLHSPASIAALLFVNAIFFFAGCGNADSKVEEIKGWTLPEGKEIRRIKLKHKELKPVAGVVGLKEDAVEPLLKGLSAVPPAEACGFMVALGYIHDPKAIDPILEILKKEEGPAGTYAAFALWKLKKQGSLDKVVALDMAALPPGARLNAFRVIAWSGDSAHYGHLIKGLEVDDAQEKERILRLMAHLNSPALVEPLLEVFKAGPEPVSRAAAKVLGTNQEHLLNVGLDKLAKSDQEFVRELSIDLLGRTELPGVLKTLTAALDDPSPRVAGAAAVALANLKNKKPDKAAIVKIARLLDVEDETVSKKAYDALVGLQSRTKAAREVLVKLLDSKRITTLRYTASLLIQCVPFKNVHNKTDLTEFQEIPKLIALLSSEDKDTRMNAGNTLRLYTNQIFDDKPSRWNNWWENHKKLMKYIGRAQKLVAQVKVWRKEEAIIENKAQAIKNLEEAQILYEEVEEKGLLKNMSFDNEHLEINRLMRQVRTSGGMGD